MFTPGTGSFGRGKFLHLFHASFSQLHSQLECCLSPVDEILQLSLLECTCGAGRVPTEIQFMNKGLTGPWSSTWGFASQDLMHTY